MHTVHSLGDAVEAFLVSKRVGGLSARTLDAYQDRLHRFTREERTPDPLAVRRFFSRLQERGLKPSSLYTAYRTLKTFFRWAVTVELLSENPLRGFAMRVPKTLPQVPTEEEVRATLTACDRSLIGRRNRTLILVTISDTLPGVVCTL